MIVQIVTQLPSVPAGQTVPNNGGRSFSKFLLAAPCRAEPTMGSNLTWKQAPCGRGGKGSRQTDWPCFVGEPSCHRGGSRAGKKQQRTWPEQCLTGLSEQRPLPVRKRKIVCNPFRNWYLQPFATKTGNGSNSFCPLVAVPSL